jgi:hypothetical protein
MDAAVLLLCVGTLVIILILLFLVHAQKIHKCTCIDEYTNIHREFSPRDKTWSASRAEPITIHSESLGREVHMDALFDPDMVLEIHSNTSKNPLVLPSCRIKGIVVRKGGYLLIPSNTHIETDFITITSGGFLHIEGSGIDLLMGKPMSPIHISSHGTLWARGVSSAGSSSSTVPLDTDYKPGSSVQLNLPFSDIGWDAPGTSFVMTSCTDTYRDPDTNPVGGVPTWFNWEDCKQRAANETAIHEWEKLTKYHGVEVVTLASATDSVPLRFHHDHRGHAALLTRPIRIRSLCDGYADIDVEFYPKRTHDTPPSRNRTGHWAYGLDGTDGGHIEVGPNGHLDMGQVELWKMGSTMHYPIHVLGSAVIDSCSIWCSFSGFVEISGTAEVKNTVCFWSLVTGIRVHKEAHDVRLSGNTIIGVHNAMPGTYWNEEPYTLITRDPRDFYMTSSIWIDEPSTICRENVLCCSPSPVIGIWSRIQLVRDTASYDQCPSFAPTESYTNNTCYNMEGFWSGLPSSDELFIPPEYQLVIQSGFEKTQKEENTAINHNHWMTGANSFNVGDEQWTTITLDQTPTEHTWKHRTFFVFCVNASIQNNALCLQKNNKLRVTLDELEVQYRGDMTIAEQMRVDLENELDSLRDKIGDLEEELKSMEYKLNRRNLVSKNVEVFEMRRDMFFCD